MRVGIRLSSPERLNRGSRIILREGARVVRDSAVPTPLAILLRLLLACKLSPDDIARVNS